MNFMHAKTILRLMLAMGFVYVIGLTSASAEDPVRPGVRVVNSEPIPAMELNSALNVFAHNTGLQIVYFAKVADGMRAHGAPAHLSGEATLQKLLEGTGLTFRFINAGTVSIFRDTSISRAAWLPVSMQVAQANTVSDDTPGEQNGGQTELGEILVTAQKRIQSAFDVGINITAIGGTNLRRLQAYDVSNISDQTASVIATTSTNLPAFTIRGIGLNEYAMNFDAPVAVHVDEVYRARPFMNAMPFFDIQRVEVLEGPQGTTFGRNSPGGAVNFYTVEPQFKNEGGINVSGDQYGRFRVDGFVNPEVSDTVAARFSYFVRNGWGGPYNDVTTQQRYGQPDQFALRGQVKWQSDATSVRVTAYGFRDKSELTPYKSPGIYNANGTYCAQLLNNTIDQNQSACLKWPNVPGGAPTDGVREPNGFQNTGTGIGNTSNDTAYGTNIRVEQALGSVSLVSLTSYDYYQHLDLENGDDGPFLPPDTTTYAPFYARIDEFTQELRASGKASRLDYLAGVFFEDDREQDIESVYWGINPVIGFPQDERIAASFIQKVRSIAAFTHNEYEILPDLSIVGGVRYSSDRTELNGRTFISANDPQGLAQVVTPVSPVDSEVTSRTDSNVSFRGGFNWRLNPDNMLYTSVSRAFRSGGYNVPFAGTITTFAPEQLTAYEMGYKARLVDRKLDITVDAFRYDYHNVQINVNDISQQVATVIANVDSERTYGEELDLTWHPAQSWQVHFAATHLDARVGPTDRTITTYDGTINLTGKRPVNTPPWTTQLGVQKLVPLNDKLNLLLETDGRYVDARYLRPANQIFEQAPPYWLQNARIAVADSNDKWEFALWGKNIFNKDYLTYLNNNSFVRIEIYGEPVSYGLSASYKF
jgi:outer membrane receptor protein involved in Fe transport